MNRRSGLLVALLLVAAASMPAEQRQQPIILAGSGGFVIGGRTIQSPQSPGRTLSCDHGYVEYFLPANPRRTSLVMWHSSSSQVWQNRWDGGEGFKDMFLRRDYPVYLWDGPRVGRASWSCEPMAYSPDYRNEANFTAWNFGPSYGSWWPGVQFPINERKSWEAATAARYAEYDTLQNIQLQTDAAAAAADSGRLGDRIVYLTNSAGGLRALLATTKAKGGNIAGIVAYESIGYVFPIGDPESPRACTDQASCGFGPVGVPMEEFRKLAKLAAIQFVWGDNRGGSDGRASSYVEQSRLCAKLINKYGGRAEVLMLGEGTGFKGSTHIPFADMNNAQVAGLLDEYLGRAKLDGYRDAKPRGRWVWEN